MRGCVVLVSYNEAVSIRPVLAEIDEASTVLARSGIALDIILVDDESPDGTAGIARDAADLLGLRLTVLTGERRGPGNAFLRGFAHVLEVGGYDFVVTLDSDGQHDARQMPDLVRAFVARRSGMTIGSRWTRGGRSPGTAMHRAALSIVGNYLVRAITGLRGVADATTSFRVIHPDALALFEPNELAVDGYGFFSSFAVLTHAHGYTIDEVPITFRPRYSGVSKLTPKQLIEFFGNLFKLRRQAQAIRRMHLRDQTAWSQRSARFNNQESTGHAAYGAMAELEMLASATNFFDWIVTEIKPYLGRDVLEVGAGIGTVTRRIAAQCPEARVLALEPAEEPYSRLRRVAEELPQVEARQVTSTMLVEEGGHTFDAAVYVNVLEHIEHDTDELRRVRALLRPGGTVCVFVPAAPQVYGSMDYISGHYRRYNRATLERVMVDAGYEIASTRYFDVAGLVPYWLAYRVLDFNRLGGGSSTLFDNVLVPISRGVQRVVKDPPIGKNLLVIGRSVAVPDRIEPRSGSADDAVEMGHRVAG